MDFSGPWSCCSADRMSLLCKSCMFQSLPSDRCSGYVCCSSTRSSTPCRRAADPRDLFVQKFMEIPKLLVYAVADVLVVRVVQVLTGRLWM